MQLAPRMREWILSAMLLSMGSTLSAQQWTIDAQAGKLRSELDPNASVTENIVVGLRYDDALTGFRVSGGVPTGSQDALWGSLAAARGLEYGVRAFVGGVDLAGNAFLIRDRAQSGSQLPGPIGQGMQPAESSGGHALAGQLMPLIGYETAHLQIQARAGVSYYSAGFGGETTDRTVQLADLQLTYTPSPSIALIPAVRFYRAAEGDFTYAGATAITASGPASAWASVGSWLNRTGESVPWAVGASLRVHD